jgi:hypothetical protein
VLLSSFLFYHTLFLSEGDTDVSPEHKEAAADHIPGLFSTIVLENDVK